VKRVLVVALLAVLAGCSAGYTPESGGPGAELGEEWGYSHDAELDVTPEDGLNETELEAVVARTAARVELVRGLEFRERVPVRVVSRESYRSNMGNRSVDPWAEQVWEAPLLVGEDRTVAATFDAIYGGSVAGYYSPGDDEIVIVSDAATPRLDTRTLAHELVHALQDQHPELSFGPRRDTRDGRLAAAGLTEGDANRVEALYDARCGAEWDCLDQPPRGAGGRSPAFDMGVFVTVFTPYAEGPGFVEALRARGGWAAVNDAYDRFPESTEQVLHPDRYPTDAPTAVRVPDRSDGEWDRFEQGTETLGEATLYASLWSNGLAGEGSPYAYDHPAAAGWDGDTLVPYTNGSAGGYVWRLTFDSTADAREFRDAYARMLRAKGGERVDGALVVPDGPFADAFRVTRDGDTVTVVNAPTVADLGGVHGSG
jgi:hypothetical protein